MMQAQKTKTFLGDLRFGKEDRSIPVVNRLTIKSGFNLDMSWLQINSSCYTHAGEKISKMCSLLLSAVGLQHVSQWLQPTTPE